jgi:hypothetical protein
VEPDPRVPGSPSRIEVGIVCPRPTTAARVVVEHELGSGELVPQLRPVQLGNVRVVEELRLHLADLGDPFDQVRPLRVCVDLH